MTSRLYHTVCILCIQTHMNHNVFFRLLIPIRWLCTLSIYGYYPTSYYPINILCTISRMLNSWTSKCILTVCVTHTPYESYTSEMQWIKPFLINLLIKFGKYFGEIFHSCSRLQSNPSILGSLSSALVSTRDSRALCVCGEPAAYNSKPDLKDFRFLKMIEFCSYFCSCFCCCWNCSL